MNLEAIIRYEQGVAKQIELPMDRNPIVVSWLAQMQEGQEATIDGKTVGRTFDVAVSIEPPDASEEGRDLDANEEMRLSSELCNLISLTVKKITHDLLLLKHWEKAPAGDTNVLKAGDTKADPNRVPQKPMTVEEHQAKTGIRPLAYKDTGEAAAAAWRKVRQGRK